ncbi:hypothetical protein CsSME_00041949 [Camellia sinensis var. sinensis]
MVLGFSLPLFTTQVMNFMPHCLSWSLLGIWPVDQRLNLTQMDKSHSQVIAPS